GITATTGIRRARRTCVRSVLPIPSRQQMLDQPHCTSASVAGCKHFGCDAATRRGIMAQHDRAKPGPAIVNNPHTAPRRTDGLRITAHERMADAKLRQAIALEAARLMYERLEFEYYTAKRKAAKRLCRRGVKPEDLPSNAEIRDQIQVFARIHEGDKRTEHLREMRLE